MDRAYSWRQRSGTLPHASRVAASVGNSHCLAFASPRSGPRTLRQGLSSRTRRSGTLLSWALSFPLGCVGYLLFHQPTEEASHM